MWGGRRGGGARTEGQKVLGPGDRLAAGSTGRKGPTLAGCPLGKAVGRTEILGVGRFKPSGLAGHPFQSPTTLEVRVIRSLVQLSLILAAADWAVAQAPAMQGSA